MSALPTLKLRVLPTFPSAVFGSGLISVTKTAGVYTISFATSQLGLTIPPFTSYPTDFVPVYDSVAQSFINVSLSTLSAGGQRIQRSVVATPIVISSFDQILNCNINADAACALPIASTRSGVPLTFKDLGHASAHNITLTPNGTEKIDGLSSVKLTNNFQEITIVPFNDGTNTGWFIS